MTRRRDLPEDELVEAHRVGASLRGLAQAYGAGVGPHPSSARRRRAAAAGQVLTRLGERLDVRAA